MLKAHLLAAAFLALLQGASAAEIGSSEGRLEETRAAASEVETDKEFPSWKSLDRWSFQAGIGFISGSTIDEILTFHGKMARGDAAGEIYLLQVSYKAAEFKPVVFGHRLDFDLEAPFVLGIVDERGREPFLQYNGGLTVRWKTFPWNRWLYTNLETGCGLTYSEHVLATERQRHPSRERSHLEFYWPTQLMLAHPRHRDHQLVLFLHHHSGATIFHRGGANTLGVGYRYVPGER